MSERELRVIRLVSWRVLPLLMAAQLLMNLDRSAISFAALDMTTVLGLSPEQFGFAAGVFFWGYLLFEIPSNYALRKLGARVWIARIMLTWGIITALMAIAFNFESLAVLRFLLGAAEAGLTPGTWYLVTQWLPQRYRSRAVGRVVLMSPVANVIGAPIAAVLLPLTLFGLDGWRWLFIALGGVTVLFAIVFFLFMPASAAKAKWLDAADREWLTASVEAEVDAGDQKSTHRRFLDAIKRPAIWGYSLCYFFISVAIFGTFLWLPQVIKAQFVDLESSQVALVTAIPYICGAIALIVVGRTSDRSGDRRWHLVAICAIGAIALATSALAPDPMVRFVALCIGVAAVFAYLPAFWPNPMSVLAGSAAAGGLALINALGTFGGFFGPSIVGVLNGISGNFETSLALFAGFFVLAGILPAVAPRMFPRVVRVADPIAAVAGTEEATKK